jgi:CBS domain containing-hemolysin-like protein
MFAFNACLHAAEISITTLYPWKVREFAEEEGPRSPFAYLNADITRVLTTILVLSTASQVVSTVLFTTVVGQLSGHVSFTAATTFLALLTLFFGELLPKALGVAKAEGVARAMVPLIAVLAVVLSPVALASKALIQAILQCFGVFADDEGRVSEEELRLMVMGAKRSGGIEQGEAAMVEGVLDLQDMRVSEVMRPRISVEALDANATLHDFLHLVNTTKYSRIPVSDRLATANNGA